MNPQNFFSTCFLAIGLASCTETVEDKKQQPVAISAPASYDTSIIAVLPFDSNSREAFTSGMPAELTAEDFPKIEALFQKCAAQYHSEQPSRNLLELTQYKRQYLAITNAAGEKEVWINCFCGDRDTQWRKRPFVVMDGGNCYFNLKVNLTRGTCYELLVNGEA